MLKQTQKWDFTIRFIRWWW